MKRTTPLVLVLTVLALVAVLLFALRERRAAVTLHDAAVEAESERAAALDLAAEADTTAPDREAAAPAASAIEAPAPVAEAATDGFALRVLRHDTGAPVPNARVFALALETQERESALYRRPLEMLAEAEEHGTRYAADATGRVVLPRKERRCLVYAEHDAVAGFLHLGAEAVVPSEIYVYDDAPLRVRVADERGAAQSGVEVALFTPGWNRFRFEIADATTDESGAAVFDHVGLMRAQLSGGFLYARVRAPFDPPIEREIDAAAIARGEVSLVLTASGEVEVLLQGADGTPWPESRAVELHADRLDRGPYAPESPEWTTYPDVRGRLLVPRVGIGLFIHARVIYVEGGSVHGRVVGPAQPGARATLTLVLGEPQNLSVFEARLLDDRGEPIANRLTWLAVAFGSPISTRSLASAKSNALGIMRRRATFGARNAGAVRLYYFTRTPDQLFDRLGTAELTAPFPPGPVQVGDVVLRTPPPFCGGRVTAADGRPLAGVDLMLSTQGSFVGVHAPLLRTKSDADGRFTIRGVHESPQIFVSARADGFGEALVELGSERFGLEIVLDEASRIRGSIAPSKHFRMDEVAVLCASKERKTSRFFSSRTRAAHGSGAFEFTDVPAGELRVQVAVNPMVGGPLFLADVRATSGEDVADPALQHVDLDARLHVFELLVRTPEGAEVPSFVARARTESGEQRAWIGEEGYRGRIRFTSTSPRIEVRVSALGRRGATAICDAGATTIVLPPPFEVVLVCKECVGAVPKSFALVPGIVRADRESEMANEDGVGFDALGVCRFAVAEAGEMELWLYLRKEGSIDYSELDVTPVPKLEIRDVPGVQTFEVELPRAALEKALAEARK